MAEGQMLAITVPRDHQDPGTSYTLAAEIHGGHSNRPAVVFLTGGPGEPGTKARTFEPFRRVIDRLAQDRLVVLLDQRGTGSSEPMIPLQPIKRDGRMLRDRDVALDCLRGQAQSTIAALGSGFRPETVTAWQSAQDLQYVADQLGAEQIDLVAYSYGTHLAQAMLKSTPHRIRRVVLCGFEGPDQTYKLPSRIAEQWQRISAQHGAETLISWLQTLGDLADSSIRVGDWEVGRFGLQWIIGSWIGVSNRYAHLPALFEDVRAGGGAVLSKAVDGFAAMLDRRSAAYYLKDAASGMSFGRELHIALESKVCELDNGANFPFPQIRDAWKQIDLGDDFRSLLHTDHEILMLVGEMDGFTPVENALESLGWDQVPTRAELAQFELPIAGSGADSHLPNAQIAMLPNAAHNDLLTFDEAPDWIANFLDAGQVVVD